MSMRAKIIVFLAKATLALLIGNVLFHVAAHLPFDMPYRVDLALRWSLHVVGRDDLANPDDMDVIVGLGLAILATALGAALVWGGDTLIRRRSARRSQA